MDKNESANLGVQSKSTAFTILELLIVVLIIAILAVLGITRFLKTIEVSRADQAISSVQQIAAAQHQYNVAAGSNAAQGAVGQITNSCNDSSQVCGSSTNPQCNLVRCNYLSRRDWDSGDYNVYVLNPLNSVSDAATCGFAIPAGASAPIACATRKICGGGATSQCVQPT